MFYVEVNFTTNVKERFTLREADQIVATFQQSYRTPFVQLLNRISRQTLEYSTEGETLVGDEKMTVEFQAGNKELTWKLKSKHLTDHHLLLSDPWSYPNPTFVVVDQEAKPVMSVVRTADDMIVIKQAEQVLQSVALTKKKIGFELETALLTPLEITLLSHAVLVASR